MMQTVVIVTTGGTIASTRGPDGAQVARVSGEDLLHGIGVPAGVVLRVVEASRVNSYAMDFYAMDHVVREVKAALADPDTCGVVVTHGTDTLEETAMLLDLRVQDERPVVVTGAQRSADDSFSDGPANLRSALAVALSIACRGLGVLVCFGGVIHAARGTRKVHNSSLEAFYDADQGPIGITLDDGSVRIHTKVSSDSFHLGRSIGGVRVDTIAMYPGADGVQIDACIAAGAKGIVLQATGYGNGPLEVARAAKRHIQNGIPVVLSSRVQAGAIRGVYGGGGGGADLLAAGAIPAGRLRPSQARILLAVLLADDATEEQMRAAFAFEPLRYVDRPDTAKTIVHAK